MKAEKVKEGYTVYTLDNGEKYRIVEVDKKEFEIEYLVERRLGFFVTSRVWLKYDLRYLFCHESLEDAVEYLREKEKLQIVALNYPIYH